MERRNDMFSEDNLISEKLLRKFISNYVAFASAKLHKEVEKLSDGGMVTCQFDEPHLNIARTMSNDYLSYGSTVTIKVNLDISINAHFLDTFKEEILRAGNEEGGEE
jgi:methionine synthase II (cobalamin-independent)